jgi:hypothetical protein
MLPGTMKPAEVPYGTLDLMVLGHHREQPPREVLRDYPRRRKHLAIESKPWTRTVSLVSQLLSA